jgi:hypothetical protein
MHASVARLQGSTYANDTSVKIIPILLALTTVAAGAIVVLAFQQWVDFGITETRGIDAEAATGIGDGWFVAGLGSAIVVLTGGVIFRQQLAPALLPMIALGAAAILAIAGFDTVTNWHASGIASESPGVLVQAQGDPTIIPYAIAALAILIALSSAVIRGILLRQDPHLLGDLAGDEDGLAPAPEAPAED